MGGPNGKSAARKIVSIACILALMGCAGLTSTSTEPLRTYLLEARIDRTEQTRPIPLTLEISPPRAAPGYDTASMAFVRQPHELEYFAKNRWADAPARMLSPLLVGVLEQRAGFRAVVPAGGTAKGDMRLDPEIILLQQEFTTSPSRLHLVLRIQLVELANRRVLATRVFEEFENAPSEDPYGGVIAANRALTRMLEQIADFSAFHGMALAASRK